MRDRENKRGKRIMRETEQEEREKLEEDKMYPLERKKSFKSKRVDLIHKIPFQRIFDYILHIYTNLLFLRSPIFFFSHGIPTIVMNRTKQIKARRHITPISIFSAINIGRASAFLGPGLAGLGGVFCGALFTDPVSSVVAEFSFLSCDDFIILWYSENEKNATVGKDL